MQKNKQDLVQLLSPDGPALRSEKQITTGKNTECVNPGEVMVPEFKNTAVLKCIIISLGSYLQALFGNVIPHGGKWQILTAALHLMWIFFVYFFFYLCYSDAFTDLIFKTGADILRARSRNEQH